jgi:hypothetical protein
MNLQLAFDEQVKAHGTGTLICGFPVYTFRLKETVDRDSLVHGAQEAMACHPLFRTRLTRNGMRWEWAPNDRPVIIREAAPEDVLDFGDAMNNYYPWTVFYAGSEVYFTCTHALTDGHGAVEFMKTVLTGYFRARGVDLPESVLVRTPQSTGPETEAAELEVPDATYGLEPCQGIWQRDELEPALLDPVAFRPADEAPSSCLITLDAEQVAAHARRHEVTVFATLSYLFAKALLPLVDDEGEKVGLEVAVDLRRMLGSSTMHNCVLGIPVLLGTDKLRDLPPRVMQTAIRSQFDLAIDETNIRQTLYGMHQANQALDAMPELLDQIRTEALHDLDRDWAKVIYTHVTKLGMPASLEDLLDAAYIGGRVLPSHMFLVCAMTAKGRINMDVTEASQGDVFTTGLCDQLDKAGLAYTKEPMPPYWSTAFRYEEPL